MIENELLLLGLIREGPKHGYDIKKEIQDIVSVIAGIEQKSIYYPLKVLEKKGLIVKRACKKGNRPTRFVYALTSRGGASFNKLLTNSFLDFKRPQFSLDLSLYFLPYIKPAIAKRRLRARIFILQKLAKNLKLMIRNTDKKPTASLACILEHNLRMLDAEREFLNDLTKTV
ncbi:MAG: PadR family transcriptional regulator [Candidatus Omnitrophota bacterium]|jgi:DNA-binding PadR family transcriptional regulator